MPDRQPHRPDSPRIFEGRIEDAYRAALDAHEPIFVPARIHVDDRGWSLMNQLQGVLSPDGQVNYSVQFPGVVKAWHLHQRQTDFWMCVMGQLKAGVHRTSDGRSWMIVTGERRPGVLVIPPGLWHGAATVGPSSAGLLYYLTQRYDPASPDEERRGHDTIEGFPWQVQHG